jgi:broad specificity phosphatase PhoE
MSRLLLVRHAQASFLSENYDQLSRQGETQARLLGEYWGRRKTRFDRVACGPAVRHQHTAKLAAEAYRIGGFSLPAPVVLKDFDEFQGDAVLAQCLPQLCTTDRRFREMNEAFQSSITDMEKHATLSAPLPTRDFTVGRSKNLRVRY